MEPSNKRKVTVSLIYAIQVQGWWFYLFESFFKISHNLILKKIAKISWRWSQSREWGGSSVNRKPIKICVNEENGFKYQDNTCNTCQTQGWETSQISNCAMSEQILLPSPQSWPALTWGKNKSNIQFAGDMGSQIFYTLPQTWRPLFLHPSFLHVCCPGQDAESCGQMIVREQTSHLPVLI